MSKHTPGPWRVWAQPAEIRCFWKDALPAGSVCIETMHTAFAFGEAVAAATNAADARLIAAAPDMLEALRAIADHHIEINTKAFRPLDHSKTLRIAWAAIAKAEGREP